MLQTFETIFFSRQMAYLEARDLDNLLNQYHDNAVLIRVDLIIRERAAIHQFFQQSLEHPTEIELRAVTQYQVSENTVFAQLTITSSSGDQHWYYILILRNGKIAYDIYMPLVQRNLPT